VIPLITYANVRGGELVGDSQKKHLAMVTIHYLLFTCVNVVLIQLFL